MSEESIWLFCLSPKENKIYYYNTSTNVVTWLFPSDQICYAPLLSTDTNIDQSITTPGYISFFILNIVKN